MTVIACPTITWSSNNTSIATVNSTGLVTAVTVGTTKIRATSGDIFSEINITVNAQQTQTENNLLPIIAFGSIFGIILITAMMMGQKKAAPKTTYEQEYEEYETYDTETGYDI